MVSARRCISRTKVLYTATGVSHAEYSLRQIPPDDRVVYTNGSLALTMLLSDPAGSPPRYLVYVNRSAVDVVGGFLGICRVVIERRVRSEAQRLFDIQRTRIERSTLSAVAED